MPDKAYDVYAFIKASLPVPACFGMGIGEVEKSGEEEKGLRGTAFYRARDALESCKKKIGLLRIKASDRPSQNEEIINTLLRLTETVEKSWTNRQRQVINYYRLHSDLTLGELGQQMNATQPTISEMLKKAHLDEIREGEKLVCSMMQKIELDTI